MSEEMMDNTVKTGISEEANGIDIPNVNPDGVGMAVSGVGGFGLGAIVGSKFESAKSKKEMNAALNRIKQVVSKEEFEIIKDAALLKPEKKTHWWNRIEVRTPIHLKKEEAPVEQKKAKNEPTSTEKEGNVEEEEKKPEQKKAKRS